LEEARRYRHRQWEKEHASEHRCGWSKESETNEPPPSRLSGLGGGRPVGVYLHGEFRGRAKRSGSRGPSGNQPVRPRRRLNQSRSSLRDPSRGSEAETRAARALEKVVRSRSLPGSSRPPRPCPPAMDRWPGTRGWDPEIVPGVGRVPRATVVARALR